MQLPRKVAVTPNLGKQANVLGENAPWSAWFRVAHHRNEPQYKRKEKHLYTRVKKITAQAKRYKPEIETWTNKCEQDNWATKLSLYCHFLLFDLLGWRPKQSFPTTKGEDYLKLTWVSFTFFNLNFFNKYYQKNLFNKKISSLRIFRIQCETNGQALHDHKRRLNPNPKSFYHVGN